MDHGIWGPRDGQGGGQELERLGHGQFLVDNLMLFSRSRVVLLTRCVDVCHLHHFIDPPSSSEDALETLSGG